MTYIWPLSPDIPVSQEFGSNPNNGVNPPGGHTGIDFAAAEGTPAVAVGDGVIELAGWVDETWQDNPFWMMGGISVILNCGDDQPRFTYGHLSRTDLNVGDRVRQGDLIGYTGNTGHSTGPHLHFEAIPPGYNMGNGTYGRVNPRRYCSGYWTGQAAVNPQSNDVTPIPQEEDMPLSDDDVRRVADAVTQGFPGAQLIHNYRLGRGEWLGTIVGSFENRLLNEILPPALSGIQAKLDALTALATQGSGLTQDQAKQILEDAVSKNFEATFGQYQLELSKKEATNG
jgi:murein DD-endopeptidase MepM/ murein hydrolase activator NlpD